MNPRTSEEDGRRARWVACALALVTLLIYLPACFHDFILLDDPDYVSQNPIVRHGLTWAGVKWAFTTMTDSNWHPLTWISHMLDCQWFGLNAGAHHCVSVVFHAANAALLFGCLFRMTRALWRSAGVAALFAWHPLHVESVAWIAERKDVLCAFFGLLSLAFYSRYALGKSSAETPSHPKQRRNRFRHQRFDYGLALIFFALGLLAKPMLVTWPFVFLLLDYWPLRRAEASRVSEPNPRAQPRSLTSTWLGLTREKWPFFLLALGSCVVTFFAQRAIAMVPVQVYPLGPRAANAVISYVRYLEDAFWPSGLAAIYPLPRRWPALETAAAATLVIGLSLAAWRTRRRCPCFLIGWCWFLGMLVPVIGLVQVGLQAMADRYTYLPLVGIFIAVIFGIGDLQARFHLHREALAIAAGLVLAACIMATEFQLHYWQDSERLMRHALAVTRNNPAAMIVLSSALAQQHRWDEAAAEFSRASRLEQFAFDETPAQKRYRIRAHLLLAQVFELRGRFDEALTHYRDALRLDPASVEAHNNLGNLLHKMGKPDEAMEQYRAAIRLNPKSARAHENLGTVLVELGRFDDGMREYAEAARVEPDDPLPHFLMGKAWLRGNRSASAVGEFREALRLNPSDFETATYLARVLGADPDPHVRNGPEALRFAEQANTLSGGVQPLVLDTLAIACAEVGRFEDARVAVRKAMEYAQAFGASGWIPGMRAQQQLYESDRPYRETATNVLSALAARNPPGPDQSAASIPVHGSTP